MVRLLENEREAANRGGLPAFITAVLSVSRSVRPSWNRVSFLREIARYDGAESTGRNPVTFPERAHECALGVVADRSRHLRQGSSCRAEAMACQTKPQLAQEAKRRNKATWSACLKMKERPPTGAAFLLLLRPCCQSHAAFGHHGIG